mmetsp:Transcript_8725/g.19178  ORF Transcript_8725/g.19178 Transcript_8725/m.19178 type:complete len:138 (-) Transcript_8725:1112-1525(-)
MSHCYTPKKTSARLYRRYRPKAQQPAWSTKRNIHSDCSVMGPKISSTTLITVIFDTSVLLFPLFSHRNSSSLQENVDARIILISSSNRGSLCRGQGTILNSCGTLHRKLATCGMKNSSSVLLKCPCIPTTANAIPAK